MNTVSEILGHLNESDPRITASPLCSLFIDVDSKLLFAPLKKFAMLTTDDIFVLTLVVPGGRSR